MAKVNFRAGTLAQYNASTKDVSTLYFVTDIGKIFKGSVDVTKSIQVVTSFDGTAGAGNIAVADAIEGIFYINITTFECRIKSGTAWVIMSPGYITDGANFAQASNDGKFSTIGAIKTYLAEEIAKITGGKAFIKGLSWTAEDGNATGKLVLTHGDNSTENIPLTGLPYKFAYDEDALTLSISSYGSADAQVINLPKDNFVKSGRYEANAKLPGGGTGPAIVLVVNGGTGTVDTEVVIPAASLVDVYTGEATDTVTVSVSTDNKISATAKIDPVAGNALVSSAAGLKVDISGKLDKIDGATGNKVVITTAEGSVSESAISILSTGEMGDSADVIPVASLIASAIESAVQAAQGTLEGELAKKMALVTGAVENNIATFATGGQVKDSLAKIGGATIAATPDAKTVATEAAVAAALAWSAI